jgi:hypothetical protein
MQATVAVAALAAASAFGQGTGGGLQLDSPPTVNQKPYHPQDGSTPELNPPAFVWVPVSGAASYTVQICRQRDFSGPTLARFSDLPWSLFVPKEPLEPGSWWWRYGATDRDGRTTWSRPRRFTVDPSATKLPAPDISKLIAEIPTERPRLFILRREVESYRRRASKDLAPAVESL